MHSSTHSSARPLSAGLQARIASAFEATWEVLSRMNQRRTQSELLDLATRLNRSHPETAAQMRKAAYSTWE